jgi:hypothetical protein
MFKVGDQVQIIDPMAPSITHAFDLLSTGTVLRVGDGDCTVQCKVPSGLMLAQHVSIHGMRLFTPLTNSDALSLLRSD